MGVPNVVYKWKSLRTLYVTVFVMNVAGCVIVVIMIVSAVKLRMGIGQYLDLVVPGDANFWPGMMFLIGFLCAPIYAIGIKLCFHLRFSSPDSIPRLNKVLFVHCALCFVSMILVVGINAVGILRMVDLHRVNRNGIIESMQEYATEIISKTRIDMIQINFRCCGSNSFKDWFHVRWIQKEDESEDRKNQTTFVSTDVPFSCCATEMLKPCIHHNVLKSSEVYLYQPEHRLTISTTGCHAKVLSHARYVGGLLIVGLILLAAYQMVLALLSRLLQTAHSNAFYIGPRKGRYLAWILGSMPKPEAYNLLVYEGRDAPAEEMIPVRGSVMDCRLRQMEKIALGRRSRGSDIKGLKKPPGKKTSKTSIAERHSSVMVTTQEESKKSLVAGDVQKKTSSSIAIANSIPTPPPSPGTDPKGPSGLEKEQRPKISADEERKRKPEGARSKTEMVAKASGTRLKELRKSLECLEQCQLPWKGGSPIFEAPKSSGSSGSQSSRVNDFATRGDGSPESELERARSPPSSSSSDKKRRKVCGKDSFEEDEIRMKKFCKDLSTEYKKSPYSKQRRDFSEEYKRPDPTPAHPHMQNRLTNTDDGLMIRNQVCAKFNPADAYSRFRGSAQDTMMRRSSQTHPQPPPIPISDQRTLPRHDHCRPCQQFSENPQFIARPILFDQFSKPQTHALGPSWPKHQKLGWGPRRQPAPTYFPTSSRPPRPPRLPPCPYASRDQTYAQNVQNRGVRTAQFNQNMETGVDPRFQRRSGRHQPGLQPPRFSGC